MSGAEKNFENRIKRFLKSEGIYPLGESTPHMKVPSCGYYDKRHGNAVSGKGLPDLYVVVKGKAIELETKKFNGIWSAAQKYCVKQINDSGGTAFFVEPDDFEFIKSLILRLKK